MPITLGEELPEDDPIFTGQVSFVFRSELPEDEPEPNEEPSDTRRRRPSAHTACSELH
jgi:hypothetical protein